MNRFLLFLGVSLIFSFNLYSQQSASVIWNLTENQSAIVTGNITAPDQQLNNMQVSYSSSVQRSSPAGTPGTWPGESTEDTSRYLQFIVTPSAGYYFNTASVSMFLYANSGSNMKANVYFSKDPTFSSKTQIGTTFSLASSAPSSPNVTSSPNITVNSNESFYVRIYPWYTAATTGKYLITNTVTITGTTGSMISVIPSVTDLFGFVQTATSPSLTQTYSLTGTSLTDGVVITPPNNFEISADGGSTWHNNTDPITLAISGGVITGEPVNISVRLHALSSGEYNDTIKHSSTGAPDAYINVSGAFLADEPSVASTVSFGTTTGKSMVINFSGGNGASRVVIARKDSVVNWIPTDGIPVYDVNADFSKALNQYNGNKAVYDGTGNSVTMNGLTSNSTYHIAVYEYNTGSGNSQNYLTTSVGSGDNTTLAVAELLSDPFFLAFGNRVINKDTVVMSYKLSGSFLTGSGNISITVPAGGFDISLSQTSGFTNSLSIPYSTGSLSPTTIYVRFIPTILGTYSDTVTNSGGGAVDLKLPVSGKGIATEIDTDYPVGFATVGRGTTGGQGTDSTFIITDAPTLAAIMKQREGRNNYPIIIYISGTIAGYSTEISVKRTENISIIGLGTDAGFLGFGMKFIDCKNIIVRNMKFADCHVDEKDGISIESSSNVWIDHCSFTDSPSNDPSASSHDGELDTKKGSFNVTISYNHFMNHRKTCLLGHTTSLTSDTVMTVTYYRNWFDGTYSRHPRIRFAKTHLLNNLYSGVGSGGGYGVGVTCIAQVLLEGNYFENAATPVLISLVNDPAGTLSHDPAGFLKSIDNFSVSSGPIVENLSGYSFDPNNYYTYSTVDPSTVKSIVTENAGSGILNIKPLPVELTSFKASVKNNIAELSWQTATETNNYGFEIEKKGTTLAWNKIGFIAGHGTSVIKHSYVFSDKLGVNDQKISYRLKQIDINGKFSYSNEVELTNDVPTTYALEQNYPNPFNPITNISFSLPVDAKVVIKLYNILGAQVATILDKELSAGRQQLEFRANRIVSGVYFYSIEASGKNNTKFKAVKKLMILK